jgi:long-chain fatty acid transport protein
MPPRGRRGLSCENDAGEILRAVLFGSVLLATVRTVHAAGIALYETGAPDLGTASAGRTAMAADASMLATNPAGMTLLDRLQDVHERSDAARDQLRSRIRYEGSRWRRRWRQRRRIFPDRGSFYAHKLTERLWAGVAVDSDFGLASDYSLNWVGRYYLTNSSLITGQINPNIAYRINDWLSVGAGFGF